MVAVVAGVAVTDLQRRLMDHEDPTPYGNVRVQRLILRLMAATTLIALPAVILPRLAVEKLSWLTSLPRLATWMVSPGGIRW